jgi:O-antigen ligase/Flp pilus assembly protein TadD
MKRLIPYLDGIPFAVVLATALLLPVAVCPSAQRYVVGQDAAAAILVSLAFISIMLRWTIAGRISIGAPDVYAPLTGFLALAVVSLLACRWLPLAGLHDVYRAVVLAGIFFLTVSYARSGTRPIWLIACWAASCIPLAVLEATKSSAKLAELFTRWNELWIEQRIGMTLGNPNIFGGYMAAVAVLVVPFALRSARERKYPLCAASCVVFLVAAAGTWLSHSIGARIALILGLAYLGLWVLPYKFRRPGFAALCAIPSAALTAVIAAAAGGYSGSLLNGTLGARAQVYLGAVRIIATRPFFGYGPGSFVLEFPLFRDPASLTHPFMSLVAWHSHDHLLEAAAEYGLPAAVILTIFYIWCLVPRKHSDSLDEGPSLSRIAAGGACFALLCHGLGSLVLDATMVPAAHLWLGLGLACPARRRATLYSDTVLWIAGGILTALLAMGTILPVNHLRSERYAARARTCQNNSSLSDAIRFYDAAVRLRPWAVDRLNSKGICELNAGRFRDARATFTRVLRSAPVYGETPYLLAEAHRAIGQKSEAWQILQKWMAVHPAHPNAISVFIDMTFEQGKIGEAQAVAREALNAFPDNPRIQQAADRALQTSDD